MGRREIVNVADQIVGSGVSSVELRIKAVRRKASSTDKKLILLHKCTGTYVSKTVLVIGEKSS